jgi:hypothetical protein
MTAPAAETNKVSPNMPTPVKFHLLCTWCGQRSERVKFSLRFGSNICQPRCLKR